MKLPQQNQPHINLGNGFLLYFQIVDGRAIISTLGKGLDGNDDIYDISALLEIPARVTYEGRQYEVVKIDDYALVECRWFEKIVIAEGIKEIGESAFARGDFREIVLPDSVEQMGRYALMECDKLVELSLPKSLKEIPYAMCAACGSLQKVVMGNAVKRIHTEGFSQCIQLNEIRLSEQLEEIGRWCFKECTALEEITLPVGLKMVHPMAFEDCSGLKKMVNRSPNFDCSGGDLIDKGRAMLLWVAQEWMENYTIPQGVEYFPQVFVGQKRLKRVVISEGVKIIMERTFKGCNNLEEVVLPESLIAIEERAFEGCKKIETITLPKGVMTVADSAFIDCMNLTKIIITGEYTEYLTAKLGKNIPTLEEIEFTHPNERHLPICIVRHRPIKMTMTNGNEEEFDFSII